MGLRQYFERGIQPRQRELSNGRVVRERGDGEDIVGGQVVDEVRDAGDIIRAGAPLATCERVN